MKDSPSATIAKNLGIVATDYILVQRGAAIKMLRLKELHSNDEILAWQPEDGGGWKRPKQASK